ncbi:MAG: hypothetical protein ACYC0A_11805, partial [Lutibacter sp.]
MKVKTFFEVFTEKKFGTKGLPAGSYRVPTSFSNLIPSIINPNLSNPLFKTITPGGPCESYP